MRLIGVMPGRACAGSLRMISWRIVHQRLWQIIIPAQNQMICCSMLSLLYVCYMLIYVDLQCCIFDNTHMMLVTWFCMFYHAHVQPWHFLRFLKQFPSPRYLTRQGCIGWHDQVAVFQIVAWMHWKVSKNTHSQATWEACSEKHKKPFQMTGICSSESL